MEKYDNYKDSGIEWIGEIPQHWEVKKIKQFTNILTGSTPKSTEETYWNGDINWVTTDDLGKLKTKDIIESRRQITEKGFNSSGTYLAPVDSIVLSTRAPIGHIGILKIEACTNQGCKTIIANKKFDSVFLYYYLHSGKSFLNSLGVGTTFVELPTQSLKDFTVPFPTPEEQTAIANYLDRKTAEIDELIADKKRLLELYEEEKTAIINQAVTKGINPDTPMKDSGIEWLGEIPEHWEVKKLSGVCSFVRGNSSFKKDELLNIGNYVALQYGKTYKVDEVDENFNFYVNDGFYKNSQVVNYGDVIIISTSETIEDLGHSAFYNRKDLGLLGGEQILLKPNSTIVNGKYLYYSSKIFTKELQKYATGLKVYRFNINDLKTIYTSIPSIQEQQSIVHHIETECALIDAKTEKTKKLIDLLTEYRTALISEVVTGKIKVTL